MTQNTSHAVMAQRAEPHDSLDDFPTPPWAARALFEHVIGDDWRRHDCWEPAANRGYMLRGLEGYFGRLVATDVFDYGAGLPTHDFLMPSLPAAVDPEDRPDWIVTNPPFRLGELFINRAREIALVGVAMLVRLSFLESVGRYERLYRDTPPHQMAQFVERVPMVKGRCDPEASTATAYCWLVWRSYGVRLPFEWIPPCRRRLERPGDYE